MQVLFYVFLKFLYGSILSKTSGKPYFRESWIGVEGWTDKSTVIYAYCDGNVFDATNEMDCCAAPEDEYCIATMPSCKINECSTFVLVGAKKNPVLEFFVINLLKHKELL